MSKIIFLIGSVSSGKSTVAKFFKNAIKLNIDDFYEKNLDYAKGFKASYRDKKFQDKCWNSFYKEIKRNKLKNKLVTAQTTGLNPRFKIILNKLRKEFRKEVLVVKIKSPKKALLKRTKTRKECREEESVKRVYKRLKRKNIKSDFIINNNKDSNYLKKQVNSILKQIK